MNGPPDGFRTAMSVNDHENDRLSALEKKAPTGAAGASPSTAPLGGGSHLRRLAPAGQRLAHRQWPVTPPARPATSNVDTSASTQSPAASGVATTNVDTRAKAPDRQRDPKASTSNVDKTANRLGRHDDVLTADMPRPTPRRLLDSRPRAGGRQLSTDQVAAPQGARIGELRSAVFERLKSRQPPEDDGKILGAAPGDGRTQQTIEDYEKRGNQLARRFRRELGMASEAEIDPREFASWLISLRVSLKSSVWRYYKQCVILLLTKVQSSDAEEAVQMIENDGAWEGEMEIKPRKRATTGKRLTAAEKAKSIDYADYLRLDAYLQNRMWSEHADTVRDWLRAGFATGLRPDEWAGTEVVVHSDDTHPNRERIYLFALNAKSTNGRANGKMRTIEISDFDQQTLNAIYRMSDRGAKWATDGSFDSMQSRCAQTLYRADKRLWPKRSQTIALYTCRHQFILNMRAIDMREAEISAMLGHLVTETQLSHYGKRGRGWSIDKITDKPRPIEAELLTVRKTLDMAEQRRRLDELINVKKVSRGKKVDAAADDGDEAQPSVAD